MRPNVPPRLPGFDYVGLRRYLLTICTWGRRDVFRSDVVVRPVERQLLDTAVRRGFSAYAYCFMPDHLHVLLVAAQENADLLAFVRLFKQVSSFAWRRRFGPGPLWQTGFHEHVVRSHEASMGVARYILENPVRAGLTRSFQDYPFSGSAEFTLVEMAELWDRRT